MTNIAEYEFFCFVSDLHSLYSQHHLDNDYCGDYVAGLSLLSARVMEFRLATKDDGKSADLMGVEGQKERHVDGLGLVRMLVQPRSFYIMRCVGICT